MHFAWVALIYANSNPSTDIHNLGLGYMLLERSRSQCFNYKLRRHLWREVLRSFELNKSLNDFQIRLVRELTMRHLSRYTTNLDFPDIHCNVRWPENTGGLDWGWGCWTRDWGCSSTHKETYKVTDMPAEFIPRITLYLHIFWHPCGLVDKAPALWLGGSREAARRLACDAVLSQLPTGEVRPR